MLDFLIISTRSRKNGLTEIYPKFVINKSNDLMIRGRDFYAIWDKDRGFWSLDEQDALRLIDRELDEYAKENSTRFEGNVKILHMWDSESGMIDKWHKFCQRDLRDSYHILDEKMIFANTKVGKRDYASKTLPYPLEEGSIDAYNRLMSVLYSPEERQKIEWAIGSIVAGDSKKIQKFMVLYGAAGTGKSTVLNIIQQLFLIISVKKVQIVLGGYFQENNIQKIESRDFVCTVSPCLQFCRSNCERFFHRGFIRCLCQFLGQHSRSLPAV